MTSTGNDIISLDAIDITRTNQPRFYSKILSPTEKTLYNHTEFATIPFENFVWLLWSIKESAYKYLKRINPDLVFIPIKFVVTDLHIPKGYALKNFAAKQIENKGFENMPVFESGVALGANTLYSRSLMYREQIVSVVNGDEYFENTYWGVKLINKTDSDYQSQEVRTFLLDKLSKIFPSDNLIVNKNPRGIPILLNGEEELPTPVSLSHHAHFVAYSFRL